MKKLLTTKQLESFKRDVDSIKLPTSERSYHEYYAKKHTLEGYK